jgi:hypothetical protein
MLYFYRINKFNTSGSRRTFSWIAGDKICFVRSWPSFSRVVKRLDSKIKRWV